MDGDFFGGLAARRPGRARANASAELEIVPTGCAVGAEIRGGDPMQRRVMFRSQFEGQSVIPA